MTQKDRPLEAVPYTPSKLYQLPPGSFFKFTLPRTAGDPKNLSQAQQDALRAVLVVVSHEAGLTLVKTAKTGSQVWYVGSMDVGAVILP